MKHDPSRLSAGKPRAISDVLAQLLARRGYAREQASAVTAEAWQAAVGAKRAALTRPGTVKRGTLEVLVANSLLVQEMTFEGQQVLDTLNRLIPEAKIRKIKYRVGTI